MPPPELNATIILFPPLVGIFAMYPVSKGDRARYRIQSIMPDRQGRRHPDPPPESSQSSHPLMLSFRESGITGALPRDIWSPGRPVEEKLLLIVAFWVADTTFKRMLSIFGGIS